MRIWILTLCLTQNPAPADPAQLAAALELRAAELFRAGRHNEAERTQRHALACWEEAARSQPLNLAAAHSNLAQMLVFQGKLTAAEEEAQHALELLDGGPTGPMGPGRASVEAILGKIDLLSGRCSKAEAHQMAALRFYEATNGSSPAEFSVVLNDLAMTVAARKDWRRARLLAERAVELRRRAGRISDPEYGWTVANLALITFRQRDWRAAEDAYREAVAVLESTLTPDHPHLGMALVEHAQVLRKLGRRAEARTADRRARSILSTSAAMAGFGGNTVDVRSFSK